MIKCGSAKVTGGPPGLQIRCEGLTTSQVGSIPMHFRQFIVGEDVVRLGELNWQKAGGG